MSQFRTRWHVVRLLAVTGIVMVAAGLVAAADAPLGNAKVSGRATITSTPQKYYDGACNNARGRMAGKYTGNGWTWHACYPMHGFIDAYLATRDTAWLDAGAKYFDWNIGFLLTGPDGHKGWLGPVSGQPEKLGEHPIGDAIMIDPMVRFAELVLKDEPALAKTYGKQANAYVTLARELVFEKWQKRGIWHEDGPYGVFTEWHWYYTEQEAGRWHAPPAEKRVITLPFNMQVHWGIVAGRIHRITGQKVWKDTALKLMNYVKSRLCLYKDHYTWNYWEPFGPWDIDPKNPQAFRHWVGTHGYRDYQAGEVKLMAEAYQRGLTFDAEDMKRLVNTNTKVMWNGSLDDVKWNNSNAGAQKAALGAIRLPSKPKGIFNRYAGILWTGLADFDPTVRKILERQLTPGTHQNAFYHNVTARRPPSYDRHYAGEPASVFDFPYSSCSTLSMATAIPSTVDRGKRAVLACLGRVPGELTIDLYSADGRKKLRALGRSAQKTAGYFNLTWDTGDTAPGSYRVRWTLKEEHRDFPITVK